MTAHKFVPPELRGLTPPSADPIAAECVAEAAARDARITNSLGARAHLSERLDAILLQAIISTLLPIERGVEACRAAELLPHEILARMQPTGFAVEEFAAAGRRLDLAYIQTRLGTYADMTYDTAIFAQSKARGPYRLSSRFADVIFRHPEWLAASRADQLRDAILERWNRCQRQVRAELAPKSAPRKAPEHAASPEIALALAPSGDAAAELERLRKLPYATLKAMFNGKIPEAI